VELPNKRIIVGGTSEFQCESEAITFALDALPDCNPHLAWTLYELLDPRTGRLYEIDLLVLGANGLYLIEIKSQPGILTGDFQDRTFTDTSGKPRQIPCPYGGTNHKAKVLASLLKSELRRRPLWIQPLVFLSSPGIKISWDVRQPNWLVTRETIRDTLVNGMEGAPESIVSRALMAELPDALRRIGLQPSHRQRTVGGYRLEQLVDEGEGYQEHHAVSTIIATETVRVRSYLVPSATTGDRRKQLERAARREAEILARIGGHPNILSYPDITRTGHWGRP